MSNYDQYMKDRIQASIIDRVIGDHIREYNAARAIAKGWKTILAETRRRENARPMRATHIIRAVGRPLHNPLTGDSV
jgi:hypothetical protein